MTNISNLGDAAKNVTGREHIEKIRLGEVTDRRENRW